MHLLTHDEDGYLILKAFTDETLPPYAILSFVNQATDEKQVSPGASSIKTIHPACSSGLAVLIKHAQGEDPDLTHFWVQSLCVDQTDPVEANETTNSIWDIHKNAIRCYVHLSDYSISNTGPAMKDRRIEHSKWFNDIWSLPVLLAASHVEFCSVDGTTIGDKISLADNISRSSGLPSDVLSGQKKMSDYTESDKMRWIRDREWICPREEDAVYALLGLFGVKMEVRYGEGRIAAMQRLGSEIKKNIRANTLKKFDKYSHINGTLPDGRKPSSFISKGLHYMLDRSDACFYCGKSGHYENGCYTSADVVKAYRQEAGLCFQCGSSGHEEEFCPWGLEKV